MPSTRSSIKGEPRRRTSPRDASRRALEALREQKKEDRRVKRIIESAERDVRVGEPTVCVKRIEEMRLKPFQRNITHLVRTSRENHATYTRCQKMWGPSSLRCMNKRCEGRGCGVIHGAHVSWRVNRKTRVRQCGVIATCASCNLTSGKFRASRDSHVFVLGKVLSKYPSKPYDPREDIVLENAIFET